MSANVDSNANEKQDDSPKRSFFYTTEHPYRWSSGPTMSTLNPKRGFERIKSLEEAKELAEFYKVESHSDDRCDTTYGVQYEA